MNFPWPLPHLRVESVTDLDLAKLESLDLNALLLDVDSTLKSYRETELSAEVTAWLNTLRAADIGLCLLSNGRGPRIGNLAERLDLPFVAQAFKPLPRGVRRAIREHDFDPERTAMVGDQLFADIMAGRAAGIRSILVRPIRPEEEPWFTRLKRPLEKIVFGCTKHE